MSGAMCAGTVAPSGRVTRGPSSTFRLDAPRRTFTLSVVTGVPGRGTEGPGAL
ncbi:MAG TPA: hypothetical protein VLW50_01625 [Streptosporangiaceae bacterium]|nr:hypothetical protein [Streptosporangiaceae bacterium]